MYRPIYVPSEKSSSLIKFFTLDLEPNAIKMNCVTKGSYIFCCLVNNCE